MNYKAITEHGLQFVKFSLVGATNTVLDFSVFFIATQIIGLHYLAANVMSWTCALISSFVLNKYWTFKSHLTEWKIQYAKFMVVSLTYLFLSLLSLYALIERAHLHKLIAKAIVVVVLAFWNFFMNKYWTFKKES